MNVFVYTHPEFERLRKKYHSLVEDFRLFLSGITNNPFQGVSLCNGIRKFRFSVASKGGDKSGGMRVSLLLP